VGTFSWPRTISRTRSARDFFGVDIDYTPTLSVLDDNDVSTLTRRGDRSQTRGLRSTTPRPSAGASPAASRRNTPPPSAALCAILLIGGPLTQPAGQTAEWALAGAGPVVVPGCAAAVPAVPPTRPRGLAAAAALGAVALYSAREGYGRSGAIGRRRSCWSPLRHAYLGCTWFMCNSTTLISFHSFPSPCCCWPFRAVD
jgi:hypothetical protein